MPPSRGLKIRTLEIVPDQQDFDPKRLKNRYAIVMKEDGIASHFHNYKTRRFSGRDKLALQMQALGVQNSYYNDRGTPV
ncbi:hypothetical protein ACROYT_G015329 [Oculina patagonica]